MMILLSICALIFVSKIPQQGLCTDQAYFQRNEQKYLPKHVIETKQADNELECGLYCVADGSFASVNYKNSRIGKGRCEINNKTLQDTSDEETHNPEFIHLAIIERIIPMLSCRELLKTDSVLCNGVYTLRKNYSHEEYQVYCHMTEIPGCGPGGWTLVMKIDGNKTEFNYLSSYWTNKETCAVEDGLEGLNEKQAKLESYWNTPFDKICLGMKVSDVTKWIVVDHQASSLFDVIADGVYKNTSAGKDLWESLMDSSLLHKYCNEGFNLQRQGYYSAYVKVRIGLVAQCESNCKLCHSCIGLGASIRSCNGDPTSTSCGTNKVGCGTGSRNKKAAFGYILVQ